MRRAVSPRLCCRPICHSFRPSPVAFALPVPVQWNPDCYPVRRSPSPSPDRACMQQICQQICCPPPGRHRQEAPQNVPRKQPPPPRPPPPKFQPTRASNNGPVESCHSRVEDGVVVHCHKVSSRQLTNAEASKILQSKKDGHRSAVGQSYHNTNNSKTLQYNSNNNGYRSVANQYYDESASKFSPSQSNNNYYQRSAVNQPYNDGRGGNAQNQSYRGTSPQSRTYASSPSRSKQVSRSPSPGGRGSSPQNNRAYRRSPSRQNQSSRSPSPRRVVYTRNSSQQNQYHQSRSQQYHGSSTQNYLSSNLNSTSASQSRQIGDPFKTEIEYHISSAGLSGATGSIKIGITTTASGPSRPGSGILTPNGGGKHGNTTDRGIGDHRARSRRRATKRRSRSHSYDGANRNRPPSSYKPYGQAGGPDYYNGQPYGAVCGGGSRPGTPLNGNNAYGMAPLGMDTHRTASSYQAMGCCCGKPAALTNSVAFGPHGTGAGNRPTPSVYRPNNDVPSFGTGMRSNQMVSGNNMAAAGEHGRNTSQALCPCRPFCPSQFPPPRCAPCCAPMLPRPAPPNPSCPPQCCVPCPKSSKTRKRKRSYRQRKPCPPIECKDPYVPGQQSFGHLPQRHGCPVLDDPCFTNCKQEDAAQCFCYCNTFCLPMDCYCCASPPKRFRCLC